MIPHIKTLFVAAATGLATVASGFSPVQASSTATTSSGVAHQFKSGAERVGEGATQIGEGIKQGAIMTWEAIKAGAAAATTKLNGDSSGSEKSSGQSARKPN